MTHAHPALTLKPIAGYWTVCIDGRPLISFASLAIAMERVPEAVIDLVPA